MLNKLTSLLSSTVKDQIEDKLVEATGMGADKADEAVKTGTETIFDSLKDQVLSGNTSELMSLIKGDPAEAAQNMVVKQIAEKVVVNLGEKVGLEAAMATKVVDIMVPFVLDFLNKKDDDDSPFSLSSMMSLLDSGENKKEDEESVLGTLAKGLGSFF